GAGGGCPAILTRADGRRGRLPATATAPTFYSNGVLDGFPQLGSPMSTKAAQYLGWANGFTSFRSALGSAAGGATFNAGCSFPRAPASVIVPSPCVASSTERLRSHCLASASASALPIGPFRPSPWPVRFW